MDKDSRIHHTNTTGTANTRYSGTRNITTDSFNGGFRLRETRNNVRIETYNMNNTGTYSQTDFVDNDNNWIEHNNANRDNAALDAHWGAEMVYDYFNQVHNRNSYNNSGAPLLSYVNANLMALGYGNNDNAFWDGNRMTYGRGTVLNPLTSVDICAHEIAHGVTGNTAHLAYRKESGAINEALSDIWAACIEAWVAPEKQRWLMGEDIGMTMRALNNPNLFNQPDTYLGANWINTSSCTPTRANDYCGVHTNSGVINYWFFLLSEGGMGTNDIGNTFWVNGIGITPAGAIVYRTQSIILQSNVEQEISFTQFRTASITAASNIFGSNSNEVVQVTNAWHAVGVGDRYQYSISGSSTLCDQATYTINNLPAGAMVQWSVNGGNAVILSGQGTSTITLKKTGLSSSQISLSADITVNGAPPFTVQKTNIQAGTTQMPAISLHDASSGQRVELGFAGGNYYFEASGSGLSNNDSDYAWEIRSPNPEEWLSVSGIGRKTYHYPTIQGAYSVTLRYRGDCGWNPLTAAATFYFDQDPGGGGTILLSPNPATSYVNISLQENKETEGVQSYLALNRNTLTTTSNIIQLWNSYSLVKSAQTDSEEYQMDLRGIPAGYYYVLVINKHTESN